MGGALKAGGKGLLGAIQQGPPGAQGGAPPQVQAAASAPPQKEESPLMAYMAQQARERGGYDPQTDIDWRTGRQLPPPRNIWT